MPMIDRIKRDVSRPTPSIHRLSGKDFEQLSPREQEEWGYVFANASRHNIPVYLKGSNVVIGKSYAMLGTGRPTEILNATIRVKEKRKMRISKRRYDD